MSGDILNAALTNLFRDWFGDDPAMIGQSIDEVKGTLQQFSDDAVAWLVSSAADRDAQKHLAIVARGAIRKPRREFTPRSTEEKERHAAYMRGYMKGYRSRRKLQDDEQGVGLQ